MQIFWVSACFIITLSAQEVTSIQWKTEHASPAASIHQTRPHFAKLVRFGVSNIPEPMIMQFAGIGGSQLGLDKKQSIDLHKAISEYYLRMANHTINGNTLTIPSSLEYCYSKKKPSQGLASIYRPKNINEKTRSIIFLHGFGGSFSYYLHYLVTIFPDHIILCPAYGISMANVSDSYLTECKSATEKHLNMKLNKPILIGLSAGGLGGFKHYSRNIGSYDRFICMASLPPRSMSTPLGQKSIIRLIAGGNEAYVKRILAQRIKKLKLENYKQVILPNQGHFFMLTDEERTKNELKKMIND